MGILPFPVTTERLVIRAFEESDRSFEEAIAEHPSLFVDLPVEPRGAEQIDEYVTARLAVTSLDQVDATCALIVESADSGDYVGSMQLTARVADPLELEIGWMALPQHHGRGYMTEAVTRVVDLAFDALGAHRIVAEITEGNEASVRLATKVGFRREARFVRSSHFKGRWRNDLVYALLADERVRSDTVESVQQGAGRPSPELCDLIAGYFRAFTSGEPDWVKSHVHQGAELRMIGTTADEWLQGAEGFDVFLREATDASGALSATVSDVEAYSLDSVGWGAARVRFELADGRKARARFSVVFVLTDGMWKVVSSHTSIPVPDDAAFMQG